MPQVHMIVRCNARCESFQVIQRTQQTRFNCRLCGEKQSIVRVYGSGAAKDLRPVSQQLNMAREGAADAGAGEDWDQRGGEFAQDWPQAQSDRYHGHPMSLDEARAAYREQSDSPAGGHGGYGYGGGHDAYHDVSGDGAQQGAPQEPTRWTQFMAEQPPQPPPGHYVEDDDPQYTTTVADERHKRRKPPAAAAGSGRAARGGAEGGAAGRGVKRAVADFDAPVASAGQWAAPYHGGAHAPAPPTDPRFAPRSDQASAPPVGFAAALRAAPQDSSWQQQDPWHGAWQQPQWQQDARRPQQPVKAARRCDDDEQFFTSGADAIVEEEVWVD